LNSAALVVGMAGAFGFSFALDMPTISDRCRDLLDREVLPMSMDCFVASGPAGPHICKLPSLIRFHPQLNSDNSFNGYHVWLRKFTEPRTQTPFGYGCNLIGHCLPLFAVEVHVGFAGIQLGHVTCERNNLDSIQMLVGCIITDDDGRPSLPNFTTK